MAKHIHPPTPTPTQTHTYTPPGEYMMLHKEYTGYSELIGTFLYVLEEVKEVWIAQCLYRNQRIFITECTREDEQEIGARALH